jgi:transcriptional regulator with XRE-family HTH domain
MEMKIQSDLRNDIDDIGSGSTNYRDIAEKRYMEEQYSFTDNKQSNKLGSGIAAIILAGLPGTGSHASSDWILNEFQNTNLLMTIESIDEAPQTKLNNYEFIEIKNLIKDIKLKLNLTISELAKIMRVKRPTIYEWMSGNVPNQNNKDRVLKIYGLSNKLDSIGIDSLKPYLSISDKNNETLLDKLSKEDFNIEDILISVNSMPKEGSIKSARLMDKENGFGNVDTEIFEKNIQELTKQV